MVSKIWVDCICELCACGDRGYNQSLRQGDGVYVSPVPGTVESCPLHTVLRSWKILLHLDLHEIGLVNVGAGFPLDILLEQRSAYVR